MPAPATATYVTGITGGSFGFNIVNELRLAIDAANAPEVVRQGRTKPVRSRPTTGVPDPINQLGIGQKPNITILPMAETYKQGTLDDEIDIFSPWNEGPNNRTETPIDGVGFVTLRIVIPAGPIYQKVVSGFVAAAEGEAVIGNVDVSAIDLSPFVWPAPQRYGPSGFNDPGSVALVGGWSYNFLQTDQGANASPATGGSSKNFGDDAPGNVDGDTFRIIRRWTNVGTLQYYQEAFHSESGDVGTYWDDYRIETKSWFGCPPMWTVTLTSLEVFALRFGGTARMIIECFSRGGDHLGTVINNSFSLPNYGSTPNEIGVLFDGLRTGIPDNTYVIAAKIQIYTSTLTPPWSNPANISDKLPESRALVLYEGNSVYANASLLIQGDGSEVVPGVFL